MHILIADDHDLFRDGVRLLLQQLDHVTICEACNREEISAELRQKKQADILLLDLGMPGMTGVHDVKEICASAPKVAVIVLSGNDASHTIDACLSVGALGFLPKSSSTDTMLSAICTVYAGGMYIPPKLYDNNLKPTLLSARQKEVCALLTEGHSNKDIAHLLSISESTVKQHISALFRRLNVSSRTQAIQKATAIQITQI